MIGFVLGFLFNFCCEKYLIFGFDFVFQYHPDVCRGNDCGVQFHQINEAYDVSYFYPTSLYL